MKTKIKNWFRKVFCNEFAYGYMTCIVVNALIQIIKTYL